MNCKSRQSILITGASGFIGTALCAELMRRDYIVRGVVWNALRSHHLHCELANVGDIGPTTDWSEVLEGVDVVIHLAALVHVMRETFVDPLTEYRRVNCAATLNLAHQAADAGLRRMVFISSIGVSGAETFGRPFAASDDAAPHSAYAVSKHEAESGLRKIAGETGLEVVIIRPPIVYGPDAPGNFNQLLKVVYNGFPLPLGAIHNQRSLVAVDNLVDLIATCIDNSAAANQTFLVSDGEDISTTDLLRRTAAAMGRKARLIPVPATILKAGAKIVGKRDLAQRLCGSLQLDITKTRELLGWSPPITFDQGLQKAVDYFLANQAR